tara:strand:- start:11413 stop:12183 length:771 start_codon:yes stop_codon:yes gene_type:complete
MGLGQWKRDWQLDSDLSRVRTSATPHLVEYKSDQFLPEGHRILDQAYQKGWLPQESINFMIESGRLQPGAVVENLQSNIESLDTKLGADQGVIISNNNDGGRVLEISEDPAKLKPNDQTVVIDPASTRFNFEESLTGDSATRSLLKEHPAYQDILKRHLAKEPGYKTRADLTDRIGELDLMNTPNMIDKYRGIVNADVMGRVNEAKSMYYMRSGDESGRGKDMSLADMKARYAWGNTARDMMPKLAATGLIALLSK